MNGWIIALLFPAALFVYIGIAVVIYIVMVKVFDKPANDDTKAYAVLWMLAPLLVAIDGMTKLFEKLTKMIDEENKK